MYSSHLTPIKTNCLLRKQNLLNHLTLMHSQRSHFILLSLYWIQDMPVLSLTFFEIKFLNIFKIYFSSFIPRYPLPPPTTLSPPQSHIHEFFPFFFPWFVQLPHPPIAVSLLCESVSILLVSSFCLLYSTYEWDHMVLVFCLFLTGLFRLAIYM